MLRDPETGFWCGKLRLDRAVSSPCGPDNDFFSSAGTGMGLVSEAVMVELGSREMWLQWRPGSGVFTVQDTRPGRRPS